MPRSSATALTGDGCRVRPRPARASGRVSTATTSWPESSSASSEGTAVSGVPAKTSLIGSACARSSRGPVYEPPPGLGSPLPRNQGCAQVAGSRGSSRAVSGDVSLRADLRALMAATSAARAGPSASDALRTSRSVSWSTGSGPSTCTDSPSRISSTADLRAARAPVRVATRVVGGRERLAALGQARARRTTRGPSARGPRRRARSCGWVRRRAPPRRRRRRRGSAPPHPSTGAATPRRHRARAGRAAPTRRAGGMRRSHRPRPAPHRASR